MDAQSLISIASKITTPIALAALALLVVSGVFTALIKQRVDSDRLPLFRDLARYGFIIGLVLGAGAIAAFVVPNIFFSEYRVGGTVLDAATGEALVYVDVAISGGPSMPTRENGSFEFPLPYSRFSDGYTLSVHDPKYKAVILDVREHLSRQHTIKLERLPVDRAIFGKLDRLSIGHWIGRPFLYVEFGISNRNSSSLRIKNVTARLESPDGSDFNFSAIKVLSAVPPPKSYGPDLRLASGDSVKLVGSFGEPDVEFQSLMQRIAQDTSQRPPNFDPNQLVDRLSAPLVHDLQENAARNFPWRAGTWQLTLATDVDGSPSERTYRFDLKDGDVERLRGNIDDYRYGFGVVEMFLWARAGGGTSLLQIAAQ